MTEADSDFAIWFAGSHVVDLAGAPLRVFHGTGSRSAFDPSKLRTRRRPNNPWSGTFSMGAYFTDDPNVASRFSGRSGQIFPVYLSIRHPFDARGLDYVQLSRQVEWLGQDALSLIRREDRSYWVDYSILERLDARFNLVPRLKRRGYDGLIWKDDVEGTTFVVFKGSQIRSVFAQADMSPHLNAA